MVTMNRREHWMDPRWRASFIEQAAEDAQRKMGETWRAIHLQLMNEYSLSPELAAHILRQAVLSKLNEEFTIDMGESFRTAEREAMKQALDRVLGPVTTALPMTDAAATARTEREINDL